MSSRFYDTCRSCGCPLGARHVTHRRKPDGTIACELCGSVCRDQGPAGVMGVRK